jgi:hypothetical protein
MAISQKDKALKEEKREIQRHKKMSESKLDKKLMQAFNKLNNKNCYAFFADEENATHQNLMDFLNLLEKRCEARYGKSKKYKAKEVLEVLEELWSDPTDRQVKTLNAINRYLKKEEDVDLGFYKITKLFKGKDYLEALENLWDNN